MAILKLTQQHVANNLICPPGKSQIEYCDSDMPGMYILVSAKNQGHGTYYLRYKDNTGKTCHQKIGRTSDITLADARKQAKTLKAEINLGANPRAEQKKQREVLTYSEFFENHYLPYVKPRKRSWYSDESLYRVHLKESFGNRKLNQITRQQIQSLHTTLKESGRAAATCNHVVKLVKHSLNLAIDWNLMDGPNPASRVPLFFEDNKKEDYLSDEQLVKLLEVLRTHPNRNISLLVLGLISTGCRLNELLTAKWSDVQIDKGIILIRATNSKNKKPRVVPINSIMRSVLEELDTEGKFENLYVNARTGSPYVNVYKSWQTLRKVAGLEHLTLHQLRHNYASYLLNAGVDIYSIKKLLGHSDIKTTERYAHLRTKTLQDASDHASLVIQGAMESSMQRQIQVVSTPALVELKEAA